MHKIRVKIEGLLDAATAVEAARLGADAVGLVFAPSPRQVDYETARSIVAALPPWVSSIGVFVNANADDINRIACHVGLTCVQLHGDEGPEMVGLIELPCLKAFRVRDENWLNEVRLWMTGVTGGRVAGIVLDAYDANARGGTGKTFNWRLISQADAVPVAGLLTILKDRPPVAVILAGGLNPDNVAAAIAAVNPYAVDVASGVESAPSVKDLAKIKSFIEKANS